jgi:hypothetical protein
VVKRQLDGGRERLNLERVVAGLDPVRQEHRRGNSAVSSLGRITDSSLPVARELAIPLAVGGSAAGG